MLLCLFFILLINAATTVANDEMVLRCTCNQVKSCLENVGKKFSCGPKIFFMDFPSAEHKFITDCSFKRLRGYCTSEDIEAEAVYVSKSLPQIHQETSSCFADEMIKCLHDRFQCDMISSNEILAKTYARCFSQIQKSFPAINQIYNVTVDPNYIPPPSSNANANGNVIIGIQIAMALFVSFYLLF